MAASATPEAAAGMPNGGFDASRVGSSDRSNGTASTSYGRFELSITPALRQLLKDASTDDTLPQELRRESALYLDAKGVPWRLAQALCEHSRRSVGGTDAPEASGVWLHEAAAGGSLLLHSPAPRARPEALVKRLEALQGDLDNKRYADMVADVTAEERRLGQLSSEMFPTTRLQLSFGLHVLVTMGTFFALGFYGGRFLTGSSTWAAAGGALGMACALLLETTLLIVRSNMPEPLDKKYAHLLSSRTDWRLKRSVELAAEDAGAGAGKAVKGQQQQQQRGPANVAAAQRDKKVK